MHSGLSPSLPCGSLKIAYDLALLYTCRHVKPPEESAGEVSAGDPPGCFASARPAP